jgi:hypothetical protein
MADDRQLHKLLDADILMTHDRFVIAMRGRLGEMPLDTKERYFAILSLLVGKLEEPAKGLQQILQECFAEAASVVMAEMQK